MTRFYGVQSFEIILALERREMKRIDVISLLINPSKSSRERENILATRRFAAVNVNNG